MSVKTYQQDDFKKMRDAGRMAANVLDYITPCVQEGISTEELDKICYDYMIKHNAFPAPLEVGFPKSICTSVNHVACHGIPNNYKLSNGDILNIDVSLKLNGWYGDTSRMFSIGKIGILAKNLINTTYNALFAAIKCVKPGNTTGDIGHAIEAVAGKNFSIVQEYCGHGIGQKLHDYPPIMHTGKPNTGITLEPGMFFTIEPIINAGKARTIVSKHDNWTVTTRDKSLSAQWEHTLAVTEDGYEIFTLSETDNTIKKVNIHDI